MIQQQYKNNVGDVSGQVQTTGFSIEVNESMFQMLTSNVYSDPMLAVVREWSTNACDACIAAEKEVKFDVHLPTLEEPNFSVRDYGTGLAPEDIVGLFSNLGASTKRNSDVYNGTLGIGRMAGLAVADAFTVESFHKGTKHSYVISMQTGVPVTMHMGDDPTTEENGLRLLVAVDTSDIGYYAQKASYLYKYFDHKPTLNRDDIDIHLKVEEHISDDWFIQKPENSYARTNYVVMSQVPYAIPDNRAVNDKGFRNLVIKAPPGAVAFNPGRESLSLNKATVAFLNDEFKKIAKDYVAAATIAMVNTTNDSELMATYKSLVSTAPGDVAQSICPSAFTSALYENLFSTSRWGGSGTPSYHQIADNKIFQTDTNGTLTLSFKSSYYKTSKAILEDDPLNWAEFFTASHVVVDLKTKFRSALNEKFSGKTLVTWQRKGKEEIDDAVEHAKRYLDGMGIKYRLASELVDVEELKVKVKREGLYASSLGRNGMMKAEKMGDSDIESGTYLYQKMTHTTPDVPEGNEFSFDDYHKAYDLLLKSDSSTPPVKGLSKKYQSTVNDLDNWVPFQAYVEEKMAEQTFKVDMEKHPTSFVHRLVDSSSAWRYPKDIQNYFNELKNYSAHNKGDSYLYDPTTQKLVEQFGAELERYEWDDNQCLDTLKVKYPEALQLLLGKGNYWHQEPELVAHLAKLEEYYAIHSSE